MQSLALDLGFGSLHHRCNLTLVSNQRLVSSMVQARAFVINPKVLGTTKQYICCGSILSVVQIFFSFVFGYGNV